MWEAESGKKSTVLRQIGHQKRSTKITPVKNLAFFSSEVRHNCPEFGQDKVNFHQKPGGDTDGLANPNWPNKRVFDNT